MTVEERLSFPGLPSLFSAGAQCGFPVEAVLSQAGIQLTAISRQHTNTPIHTIRRVFDACQAAASTGYFPLVLGDTFAFDYGPNLTTFVTSSMTLRDSLRLFEWLPVLLHPVLRINVIEQAQHILLRFDCRDDTGAAFNALNETLAASIAKFGRLLMPGQEVLTAVHFQHAGPADLSAFTRYFPAPVHFAQKYNQLFIARSAVDLPLQGAMPQLHAQAELALMRFTERLLNRSSSTERVLTLLQQQPELLGQSLDTIAAQLALHPRKLQRLLREEGTCFADVLAQVRQAHACELLEDPQLDIETISLKLGFTERRAFTLAFQRWTGKTPSAFRKAT